MKGYKVFKPDWTCRGFQYEVGQTYKMDADPICCKRGFHFCEKLADCFSYYDFDPRNHVAEVEALGEVATDDREKFCTNQIHIIKEIPWDEVLKMVNTGNYNTGYRNTGYCNTGNCNTGYCNTGSYNTGNYNTGNYNTGYRNTGYCNTGNCNTGSYNTGNYNTGYYNTGYRNTGNYNTGNYNTGYRNTGNYNTGNCNTGNYNTGDWNLASFSNGCFNTKEPEIYMFDKPSGITYRKWINSEAKELLDQILWRVVKWVNSCEMTDAEKAAHPGHETTGGYLKVLDKSKSKFAQNWWGSLSERDRSVIKALPNFDAEIFEKCTGIKVGD